MYYRLLCTVTEHYRVVRNDSLPLQRHSHPGYKSLLWRILKLISIRFTGTSLIYVRKIVFAQSVLTQRKVLGRSRNEEIFNFQFLIRFWFIKCTKTNLQPWKCTDTFIYITYEQEWPIPGHKSVFIPFMKHELKKAWKMNASWSLLQPLTFRRLNINFSKTIFCT